MYAKDWHARKPLCCFDMKILGLIPARGGSKGVPGKNIKMLGNKPLIQYTLESAKESMLLAKVIVSTDSEQIAECARSIGGDIPFLRPASLATDETPTLDVVRHALEYYHGLQVRYDAVCLLQVTTPFRLPGFIDLAIRRFIDQGADAIISVLPVPSEFNPHWVFEPSGDGYLRISTGEKQIVPRRQDLPPAYFRDGSIYITKADVLLEKNSFFGDRLAHIINDLSWHVNIDTPQDWSRAEAKVAEYKERCAR